MERVVFVSDALISRTTEEAFRNAGILILTARPEPVLIGEPIAPPLSLLPQLVPTIHGNPRPYLKRKKGRA